MAKTYFELEQNSAVKLVATDSTADVLNYTAPFKCKIREIQAHVTGTEATACVIKFDKQPTAGSATGRGDGDLGSITFAASNLQGTVLVDKPATRLTLEPGEQMVAQVTTASSADKAVVIHVLVDRIDEDQVRNNTDVSESA